MLKKVIIFAILSAVLFSSFSFFASAFSIDKSESTVEGYYLYDLDHNTVMTSENCDKSIAPSSTTKIMTACIVLESGINLNTSVTITKAMIKNVSGRSMLLKEGNVLTIEDLLYAMICGGYNDATHILALSVADSLADFVNKMNEKAVELEMNNTHYLNPTGIEQSGMYTTINDIAKLVKYMVNNEIFVNICSTKSYKLSDSAVCDYVNITNRSSLLSEYKGLSSFNVGSSDSGDCAVVMYKTSELQVISIVMQAKSKNSSSKINYAEKHVKELLSHAINDYSTKILKSKNEIIISLPIKYSISSKNVNVYLQEDLKVFISEEIDIDNNLTYSVCIKNDELIAPLKADDVVGVLNVFYDGILIASAPLVVKETIERNTFLFSMDMIKQFIVSKVFWITILLFVIFIIFYKKSQRKKFKKKKHKTRKKPT